MTKPTAKAIAAEVAKLKALKPNVKRYTFFGDDNHAAIDAQIQVLEQNLSDDDIGRRFNGEVQSEAFNARNWLDGDADEALSKGWAELVS